MTESSEDDAEDIKEFHDLGDDEAGCLPVDDYLAPNVTVNLEESDKARQEAVSFNDDIVNRLLTSKGLLVEVQIGLEAASLELVVSRRIKYNTQNYGVAGGTTRKQTMCRFHRPRR